MDEIFNLAASSIVTLLTFFTQRLVKGIDEKFDRLEKKFKNLERSTKAEIDKYRESIEGLKNYNAKIQAELVEKNLRNATNIIEALNKVKEQQIEQKLEHQKVYGKVIQLKAKYEDNRNSIAIQQKKMDLLHKKISKK